MQPPPKQDRETILDVLRGIAILGILFNNIYGYAGYNFLNEKARAAFATWPVDRVLDFLQIALIEGKFYSIFSLLFGMGFSIILERQQAAGANPLKVFYRRLLVLMLFGFAHLHFFWEGDILLLYGLVGLVLPLFRRCSDRALLGWALAFLLLPIGFDLLRLALQWTPGDGMRALAQTIDQRNGIPNDASVTRFLYRDNCTWADWQRWQEPAFLYRYAHLLDTSRIPKVLGMFLLGFYAGRKRIYAQLEAYRPLLGRLRFWGYLVGLPACFAMAFFEGDHRQIYSSALGLLDTVCYALGVAPLALAYTASVCLWWMNRKSSSRLNLFAPAGRMALTNYLTQTIIGTLLFYGAGLGLGQKFGLIYLFLSATCIYTVQVLWSIAWFRYFQYGPLEWIWRQLTYGKRLPIVRETKAANV